MWWAYFDLPAERVIGRARVRFDEHIERRVRVGLTCHYFVFGGAAATGAGPRGRSRSGDRATRTSPTSQAGLAITIPVSAYLIAVWILYFADKYPPALRNYGSAGRGRR